MQTAGSGSVTPHNRLAPTALFLSFLCFFASAPLSGAASSATSALGVYVYPKKNQSASKQATDESQCYASAEQRTGIYPTGHAPTPKPAPTVQGGAVRGAARGAAYGAAVGAIAGNAGAGAGAGALTGAIRGRRMQHVANAQLQAQSQAQANAQHGKNLDAVRRAFSACMDARGYSVK